MPPFRSACSCFSLLLVLTGLTTCVQTMPTVDFARAGGVSAVGPVAGKQTFTYTNPITRDTAISMRDHFILK